jgi:hypothetical protein
VKTRKKINSQVNQQQAFRNNSGFAAQFIELNAMNFSFVLNQKFQ